ncbi:MAG: hypothetical protein RIC16_06900 [Rhodospirillales bacterium]
MINRTTAVFLILGALAAIAGAVFAHFMALPFGAGVSPVSVDYLAARDSLLAGEGFKDHLGQELVRWPPLFPMLLAGIAQTGSDAIDVVPVLNGIMHGAVAVLTAYAVLRSTGSRLLTLSVGALVATGPPLVFSAYFVWPEPAFTLLFVVTVWVTLVHIEQPTATRLVGLTLLCAMAVMLRYAGLAILAGAVVSILLFASSPLHRRLRDSTIVAAGAGLPLMLWLLRNLANSETAYGEHGTSVRPFAATVSDVSRQASSWFLPETLIGQVSVAVVAIILLVTALIAVRSGILAQTRERWRPLAVVGLFLAGYGAFVTLSMYTFSACCADRYLGPVYPLAIVLVAGSAGVVIWHVKGSPVRRVGMLIAAILFAGWGAMNITRSVGIIETLRDRGAGYNSAFWRDNRTIAWLESGDLAANACIVTNAPETLYFRLGFPCLSPAPRVALYNGVPVTLDERPAFADRIGAAEKPVLLVWINGMRTTEHHPVDALRRYVELELVHRDDDGAVYIVSAKGGT